MIDILKTLCGTNSSETTFDRTAFWTFISAIATVAVAFIAWYQLKGLKKVSQADFIKKFNDDFFNPMNRAFILLCDNDALIYREKDIKYSSTGEPEPFPFFEVDQFIIKQLPIDKNLSREERIRHTYMPYEIDDFLGYFEDVGKFEKKEFIEIEDVYDSFGWYISKVWKNKEIEKYLATQTNPNNDLFANSRYIFNKCESFGDAKKAKMGVWFWKFRWRLSNLILKR